MSCLDEEDPQRSKQSVPLSSLDSMYRNSLQVVRVVYLCLAGLGLTRGIHARAALTCCTVPPGFPGCGRLDVHKCICKGHVLVLKLNDRKC